MKIDFYSIGCTEQPRTDKHYGICDPQDGTKAFTAAEDKESWIAEISNPEEMEVQFTAIDKCLLKDNEMEGIGRCDGMLITTKHLYFLELKDKRKGQDWKNEAKAQLISTINLFKENHPEQIGQYQHRKAFICNRRKRQFTVIDNEENREFFRLYGFRLDIQANVVLVK